MSLCVCWRSDSRYDSWRILVEENVLTSLSVLPDQPTGHCVALVQADDRTLAANIGAAAR